MKRLYGMISSKATASYTAVALESFFANSRLGPEDRFIIIENDSPNDHWELKQLHKTVTATTNPHPLSLVENINQLIRIALMEKANLFLLSNKLVFTPNWQDGFEDSIDIIRAAVTNRTQAYQTKEFNLTAQMDLSDYYGHEKHLLEISAARRKNQGHPLRQLIGVSFACVEIPLALHRVVGFLDPSLIDIEYAATDYCLRAYLKGFACFASQKSYLLEFSPIKNSTTDLHTKSQSRRFFESKWGLPLTKLTLDGDRQAYQLDPQLTNLAQQGELTKLIERLMEYGQKPINPDLQWRPSFAAVYCVYDDQRWISHSLQSVYQTCDQIYCLVGDQPWNGPPTNNAETIGKIKYFPDPDQKIQLIRGSWKTEAEQRNAGLDLLATSGHDYCLIVDADEIYEPAELAAMARHASTRRYLPIWRMHWHTYWKTCEYRIDPMEEFKPIVFVQVGQARFNEGREIDSDQCGLIPPEVGICHHLSYVRSDEEVLKKITSFSHATQIKPDWFERVWCRWNLDPSMENLNPCWPTTYRRAVKQPIEKLPRVLRDLGDGIHTL